MKHLVPLHGAAVLAATLFLSACDGSKATGLDLPEEVEFRGSYSDESTCIEPSDFSRPMTIWLYDYTRETGDVRVAVADGHDIPRSDSWIRFRATITSQGVLHGYRMAGGGGVDEEYEIKATVTPTTMVGRIYEHCGDGTADIWAFTLVRHQ